MKLIVRSFFILSGLFFCGAESAQARVFNLTKERFASYLSATYGPSKIQDGLFELESSATDYSASLTIQQGGEFGFIYATPKVSWRFGFELIQTQSLKGVEASTGSTTSYEVSNNTQVYLPKVGIELNLRTMDSWRVYLFGHFGTATLSSTQTYSSLAIAPNADFESKYKGAATAQGGGIGYEFGAFDTTSVMLELGYRQMTFTKVLYAVDVTDFQGAHVIGDNVKKTDNSARTLDFSGAYVAMGARWYLF